MAGLVRMYVKWKHDCNGTTLQKATRVFVASSRGAGEIRPQDAERVSKSSGRL